MKIDVFGVTIAAVPNFEVKRKNFREFDGTTLQTVLYDRIGLDSHIYWGYLQ